MYARTINPIDNDSHGRPFPLHLSITSRGVPRPRAAVRVRQQCNQASATHLLQTLIPGRERATDGKSYLNPPANEKSPAYTEFTSPTTNGERGGFDIHIYFLQTNAYELTFATELHERIRRECTYLDILPDLLSSLVTANTRLHTVPELRIYKVWNQPIGPHPIGMFEVNLFTPAQFGAFVPWLVINRGPLSALVHPNTDDEVRDHTQRATWMGQPVPLNLWGLREAMEKKKKEQEGES